MRSLRKLGKLICKLFASRTFRILHHDVISMGPLNEIQSCLLRINTDHFEKRIRFLFDKDEDKGIEFM